MTAIQEAINLGEYRESRKIVPFLRETPDSAESSESCKRFLIRVMARAVLDVCMYPAGNPNHESAKNWLQGEIDSIIAFEDLAHLVDLSWIEPHITEMAEQDGVHQERVRKMRSMLYSMSGNDST